MDSDRFAHLQRVATLFASSQLVPSHFQNNAANCFIAMQMAMRMHVDPFMFMQNCYIVYGRPGIEAKLAIALVNSSGLFSESLSYEVRGGPNPMDGTYSVRAWTKRKSGVDAVYGPWITWELVKAERWDQAKKGRDGKPDTPSKWTTMPEIMFPYRAGMFFARLYCPERLMGMQTLDELDDIEPPKRVESTVVSNFTRTQTLSERFGGEKPELQKHDPDSQIDIIADAGAESQTGQGASPSRQEPPAPAQEAAGAGEGETATDFAHVKTWEQFTAEMDRIGQDNEVMPSIVAACVNKLAVRKGWKGKNSVKAEPKFMQEVLIGANAGKFNWAEATVMEETNDVV